MDPQMVWDALDEEETDIKPQVSSPSAQQPELVIEVKKAEVEEKPRSTFAWMSFSPNGSNR